MRILLITETVPYPLDAGGRIKTWHTLECLAGVHEVHCHGFIRRAEQRPPAETALRRICASATLHLVPRSVRREGAHAVGSVLRRVPFTVARHYCRTAMRRIASACRDHRIDALYCDHLSTLEYGRRLPLPIIHDAHNVEHLVAQRYAATLTSGSPKGLVLRYEARMLRRYEEARYRECALILAVSDIDAATISRLAPHVPVIPVPIGLPVTAVARIDTLTARPDILFVGTLDWPPNAEAVDFFAHDIWPAILQRVPDARLTVVGRGERNTATYEKQSSRMHFTGWVADVQPYFERSRVMVVPLRSGSGMRVKILDAFARGVPVVTTRIGVEGIDAADGIHVLIADSVDEFAAATVRLLRDRALAERLSRAARELVLARYDTRVVSARMLEAVASVSPNDIGDSRYGAEPPTSNAVEFANR